MNQSPTAEKPRPMSCALDCTWPAMRAMRFMVRKGNVASRGGKAGSKFSGAKRHGKSAQFNTTKIWVSLNRKNISRNSMKCQCHLGFISQAQLKTGAAQHLCPKPKSECARSTAASSATKVTAGFSGAARKSRGNLGATV